MPQQNPAVMIANGYRMLADFQPETYQDWMYLLITLSQAHKVAAESIVQFSGYMDVIRRMDMRVLGPLYATAEVHIRLWQLYALAANRTWQLYADRIENGGRGRVLDDEGRFFGNG